MKKYRLFEKKSGIFSRHRSRASTIAVGGVSSGVGTTHSVIMMANHLRRQRLKVGVAELGAKHHFAEIEKAYEGMGFDPSSTQAFTIKGVAYHKQVNKDSLIELYKARYDVLILDIGNDFSTYSEDFQMADRSYITAALTEWKRDEIRGFMVKWRHIIGDRTKWLLPFATTDEIREFGRLQSCRGVGLGFLHDPFVRDKYIEKQLDQLLI